MLRTAFVTPICILPGDWHPRGPPRRTIVAAPRRFASYMSILFVAEIPCESRSETIWIGRQAIREQPTPARRCQPPILETIDPVRVFCRAARAMLRRSRLSSAVVRVARQATSFFEKTACRVVEQTLLQITKGGSEDMVSIDTR